MTGPLTSSRHQLKDHHMAQTILRPALIGPTRVDHDLVKRVLAYKAQGIRDEIHTTDRKGRKVKITIRSSAYLYQKVMAAKGLAVQVG